MFFSVKDVRWRKKFQTKIKYFFFYEKCGNLVHEKMQAYLIDFKSFLRVKYNKNQSSVRRGFDVEKDSVRETK